MTRCKTLRPTRGWVRGVWRWLTCCAWRTHGKMSVCATSGRGYSAKQCDKCGHLWDVYFYGDY